MFDTVTGRKEEGTGLSKPPHQVTSHLCFRDYVAPTFSHRFDIVENFSRSFLFSLTLSRRFILVLAQLVETEISLIYLTFSRMEDTEDDVKRVLP